MAYYRYIEDGKIKGPFDLAALRGLHQAGLLPMDAPASKSEGEWKPLSLYPEILMPDVDLRLHLLNDFYRDEFQRIYDSGEIYKGRWNWAAFLFGPIWALLRGMWLSVVIVLLLSILTGGIAFIVFWFIYGLRGTWMYYNVHVKNQQTVSLL